MVIKESIRDFCRGLKKSFSGKDYLRNINQCYKCGKASFFGNTCLQCETENAFGTFNKKEGYDQFFLQPPKKPKNTIFSLSTQLTNDGF